MKVGRIVCAAVMVLLCGAGWFVQLGTQKQTQDQFTGYLEEARGLASRQLYQRAVQSYGKALAERESPDVRQEMIAVYAQG